jgi:short subunit fatty acids transporter
MDVFNLIIYIFVIYIIYLLIDTISSLRDEVKEIRKKCIETNKSIVISKEETPDLKKKLINSYSLLTNWIKTIL